MDIRQFGYSRMAKLWTLPALQEGAREYGSPTLWVSVHHPSLGLHQELAWSTCFGPKSMDRPLTLFMVAKDDGGSPSEPQSYGVHCVAYVLDYLE